MNSTRRQLLPRSIGLCIAVVLGQLCACAAFFPRVQSEFMEVAPYFNMFNWVQNCRWVRGRIVVPQAFLAYPLLNQVAIDPQTGVTQFRRFNVCSTAMSLFSNGETTWTIGKGEVLEASERGETLYQPVRRLNLPSSNLFLQNDRLAIIDCDPAGRFHLLSFSDGQWSDEGEVAVPGEGREWAFDEQAGQQRMTPRTSHHSSGVPSFATMIQVVTRSAGNETVLIHHEHATGRIFLREGLEFVGRDVRDSAGSALAPENSVADVSGWYVAAKVNSISFHVVDVPSNKLMAIETSQNDDSAEAWIAERVDGQLQFRSCGIFGPTTTLMAGIVSPPDGKEVYGVVDTVSRRALFYRFDDGNWVKIPIEIPGNVTRVFSFLFVQVGRFILILIAGNLVLVIGAAWLSQPLDYSFGNQTLRLAGIGRRSLARSFDVLVGWLPLAIVAGFVLASVANMDEVCEDILFRQEFHAELMTPLRLPAIWFLIWPLACLVTQGIWGRTLGKWICRIKVVRTTLRPCGIARSLLREILFWFDVPPLLQSFVPFLATVLPGILFVMNTESRQRFGDLVAGTIVIECNPISQIACAEFSEVRGDRSPIQTDPSK